MTSNPNQEKDNLLFVNTTDEDIEQLLTDRTVNHQKDVRFRESIVEQSHPPHPSKSFLRPAKKHDA